MGLLLLSSPGGLKREGKQLRNVNFIDCCWLNKVLEDGTGVNF